MNIFENLLSGFSAADAVAVIYWWGAYFLLGWIVNNPPKSRISVAVLMGDYRKGWMRQLVTRQPRIFDAAVLNSLQQGAAFFTSACMIVIGGCLALIGNSDKLNAVAVDLAIQSDRASLELKIIMVLLLVAWALLKFMWSHRLFAYCAIMMAAVPNNRDEPNTYDLAARAAEINVTAGRSFNMGLRAVYFAIGALGWLLGPYVLLITTTATVAMLVRREFFSASRKVMIAGLKLQ